MKKIICYCIIIIAFSYCTKDDNLPPNNNDVSIKTVSHKINTDDGVTLLGEINNVEIPIEYGFFITTEEIDNYDGISFSNSKLNIGIHNGQFSIDFNSNLREGVTYYYNTLALKNGEYIYGSTQSFVSNGSAAPQIKSIFPNKAHLGDTITISGLHFSGSPKVFFNTRSANLLISNDTLIKSIVTNDLNYNRDKLPKLALTVKSSTQDEIIYDEFALHTPRVDSIRPYEVYPGDTITIYGDHFDREISGNRLIIKRNSGSSSYPRLLKANQKELVLIMYDMRTYEPVIDIESQHQTVEVKNKYKHVLPKITSVSKNVLKYGEKLKIYGSNFLDQRYYDSDSLQYKLGKKPMSFLNAYRDSLVLDINDDFIYDDFVMEGISISLFRNNINFNENIILDENYVRVSFGQGSIYSHGVINDNLYAFVSSYFANQKYLVKFNKETNRFEEFNAGARDTEAARNYALKFYGTKCYTMNGLKFFSYDIITNIEEELSSFPGEFSASPLMEVVGDYLYYGLGVNQNEPNKFDDIWRYSFSKNEWEFVIDFPEITDNGNSKINPLVFVIGSKIYIGSGQYRFSDRMADFWEFDTNTNIIVRKGDLPMVISEKITPIVLNNKAFFDYDGSTHIYDPVSDQWSVKNTGMNFDGHNKFLFRSKEFVYSSNSNSVIKIKKSYFD